MPGNGKAEVRGSARRGACLLKRKKNYDMSDCLQRRLKLTQVMSTHWTVSLCMPPAFYLHLSPILRPKRWVWLEPFSMTELFSE